MGLYVLLYSSQCVKKTSHKLRGLYYEKKIYKQFSA